MKKNTVLTWPGVALATVIITAVVLLSIFTDGGKMRIRIRTVLDCPECGHVFKVDPTE
jgi:hypothetical protein